MNKMVREGAGGKPGQDPSGVSIGNPELMSTVDSGLPVRYDSPKMRAARIFSLFLLPVFLGSLVFSQTLAEIAQKERERRASLKGKKVVVVTNADLAKMKKKPALEIAPPEVPPETIGPEAPETTPPETPQAETPPPPAEPLPESAVQATLKDLQARWEKAKEYVELLTLKMSALWQEFYALDNMTTRDAIQLSISETFIKLEKAQEDEVKARQELEKFLGRQKRESTPSIWIR